MEGIIRKRVYNAFFICFLVLKRSGRGGEGEEGEEGIKSCSVLFCSILGWSHHEPSDCG